MWSECIPFRFKINTLLADGHFRISALLPPIETATMPSEQMCPPKANGRGGLQHWVLYAPATFSSNVSPPSPERYRIIASTVDLPHQVYNCRWALADCTHVRTSLAPCDLQNISKALALRTYKFARVGAMGVGPLMTDVIKCSGCWMRL